MVGTLVPCRPSADPHRRCRHDDVLLSMDRRRPLGIEQPGVASRYRPCAADDPGSPHLGVGIDWFPPPASGIEGIRRLLPSQALGLDGSMYHVPIGHLPEGPIRPRWGCSRRVSSRQSGTSTRAAAPVARSVSWARLPYRPRRGSRCRRATDDVHVRATRDGQG